MEDPAADLDRIDDHRQARSEQHNCCGCTGSVGGPGHRNAAVRLPQGRGVVDPVACHANDVAVLLQDVDNMVFVFREDLGETVGSFNGLGSCRTFSLLHLPQACGVEDVCTQTDFDGGFLRDGQGVSRHHLHFHAHLTGGGNGGRSVFARRVEQRQDAQEVPVTRGASAGHAQGPIPADGEVVDCCVSGGFHCGGVHGQCQHHLWRTLADLECGLPGSGARAVSRSGAHAVGGDGRFSALADRVEGLVARDGVSVQRVRLAEPA